MSEEGGGRTGPHKKQHVTDEHARNTKGQNEFTAPGRRALTGRLNESFFTCFEEQISKHMTKKANNMVFPKHSTKIVSINREYKNIHSCKAVNTSRDTEIKPPIR